MILSIIVALFRAFTHVVVVAMTSPLLGAIGEFHPSTETCAVYSERLGQFFVANNIGSHPASASEEVIEGGRNDFSDRQKDLQLAFFVICVVR